MLSCSFSSPGSISNCSSFHLSGPSLVDFVLFPGLIGVLGGEDQGKRVYSTLSIIFIFGSYFCWIIGWLFFSFKSLKILLYCLCIILMINLLLKPFFFCMCIIHPLSLAVFTIFHYLSKLSMVWFWYLFLCLSLLIFFNLWVIIFIIFGKRSPIFSNIFLFPPNLQLHH